MKDYQNYVFSSGEYKGRNLRDVLIIDPAFLGRHYNRILLNCNHSQKNAFTLAIYDLITDIGFIKAAQLCPICGQNEVKFFLVPEFGGLKKNLVCCCKKKCHEAIFSENQGQLVGIHNFFIILGCLNGQQRKVLNQIFQAAYPPHHLAELLPEV